MPWNLNSDRPIFLQIVERIQTDIISGKYKPGDKLPSVRDQRGFGQSEHDAKGFFRTRTSWTCLHPADGWTFYYGGH